MTLTQLRDIVRDKLKPLGVHILCYETDWINDYQYWSILFTFDKSLISEGRYYYCNNGVIIPGVYEVWAYAESPEELAQEFYRSILRGDYTYES